MVKNSPEMQETWVQSLVWEDPLEEGMATHFSIPAWRKPTDRGTWWPAVHGVAKSQAQVSNSTASRKGNVVSQFPVTQLCTSYVKTTLLRFFLLDSRLFSPENTTSTLSTEKTINSTPSRWIIFSKVAVAEKAFHGWISNSWKGIKYFKIKDKNVFILNICVYFGPNNIKMVNNRFNNFIYCSALNTNL